ncbi:hypothetical protein KKH43_06200 [Patescibacteria group bacterium]|nr:hypothetical protein [Patescibacteria group bacterium]
MISSKEESILKRQKIISSGIVILFVVFGAVMYRFQLGPALEGYFQTRDVVLFVEEYNKEVYIHEGLAIADLMEKDGNLQEKDQGEENEARRSVWRQRKELFNEASKEASRAQEKMGTISAKGTSVGIQEKLISKYTFQAEGYESYVKGFDNLLAGEDGAQTFEHGSQLLLDAQKFEEEAQQLMIEKCKKCLVQ